MATASEKLGGERFVPFSELRTVIGINYSRVHIGRLVKAGAFPRPVHVSTNRVAWRLRDLESWMASRR